MKKQLLTLGLIGAFALSSMAQTTGYNHYQSFGKNVQTWQHKTGTKFIVQLGHYKENYLMQFDLESFNYTYLRDSLYSSMKYFVFDSDSGYATGTFGKSYYTYDNWKTIIENTTAVPQLLGVKKTSTGFIGYKTTGAWVDIYFSTDLINWTKSTTLVQTDASVPPIMEERQGQLTVFSSINIFLISQDGGQTFTKKEYFGTVNKDLSEIVLMSDTSTILAKNGNDMYFTKDAGKTWVKSTNSYKTFYASNFDSLFATSPSRLDSLFLSTDTGKTWKSIAEIPKELNGKRIQKHGEYFVETSNVLYSKNVSQGWIALPRKNTGTLSIAMRGNQGIIGGANGLYSYTKNGGKTFENSTIVNAKNLTACKIINDTFMLVGDGNSNIYKSIDGGVTWNKEYSNSQAFTSRKFGVSADLNTIVLFRAGQNVYSHDKGVSWNILGSLGGSFDGSVTPSGKILIVLGDKILEMKKSDGSTSTVNTFANTDIKGAILEMIDDKNGYVIATNLDDKSTVIYRTTDGWTTFTKTGTITEVIGSVPNKYVPSITVPLSLALNVISPDTLYINRFDAATGEYSSNVVYKSFDGGVSWTKDSLVAYTEVTSTDRLYAMHFFDGTKFISVWTEGRIFLNKNLSSSPTTTAIDEVIAKIGNSIAYPNPFTNTLTIEANSLIQDLRVFDICGKVVKSDTPEGLKHTLDLSDFSKGIYFVSVSSNGKRQIIKVIKQ